ncbi:MAG: hypothetical protein ACPL1Y_05105 [Thermoplasmata archaeon]
MSVIKVFDEDSPPLEICVAGCGGAGINTLREIRMEHPRIKKIAINLCMGGSLLSASAHHKIYLSDRNLEHYTADDVYHLTFSSYNKIVEAIGQPDVLVVIFSMHGRTGIGVARALKQIYENKLVIHLAYSPFCFEGSFDAEKTMEYLGNGNIWLIDNQMIADLCRGEKMLKVLKIANQMACAFVEHIVNGFTRKSIEVLKKHPVRGKADMGMGVSLLQALNEIDADAGRTAFVSVKLPEKEAFAVEHFAKYIEETGAFAKENVILSSFSGFRTEILAVKEM